MKTNQIKKLQLHNLIWRLRGAIRRGFNDAWMGRKRISPTAQLKYVRWKIREAKTELATIE